MNCPKCHVPMKRVKVPGTKRLVPKMVSMAYDLAEMSADLQVDSTPDLAEACVALSRALLTRAHEKLSFKLGGAVVHRAEVMRQSAEGQAEHFLAQREAIRAAANHLCQSLKHNEQMGPLPSTVEDARLRLVELLNGEGTKENRT